MLISPDAEVERLTRRGLRLAQFTLGYNVVEGAVAITAGLLAGLVSVVGFGTDSGIESITAVLVSLRLAGRLRGSQHDEARERRTLRLVAASFFLLAAYLVVEGVRGLVDPGSPDRSVAAMLLLTASLVVMPVLATAKVRVGRALADPLILADAAQTRICVALSASTLLGVALVEVTGAGWFDPVAGFVIAAFAAREGREAWEGELVEGDHDED